MIPDGEQDGIWARLRDGVLLAAKAAVAVAALSGVAQWVSRTTLDRGTLGDLTSRARQEPRTTGSITPRARPSVSPRAGTDQAGMASLVSQVAGREAAERKR